MIVESAVCTTRGGETKGCILGSLDDALAIDRVSRTHDPFRASATSPEPALANLSPYFRGTVLPEPAILDLSNTSDWGRLRRDLAGCRLRRRRFPGRACEDVSPCVVYRNRSRPTGNSGS